jgi:UDP-4-amino-4,6-dideoxy-N-acetyl-beta-L-altrosamine transaminase
VIPYGRQDINQADIDAVVDVLRSDFITQGEAVPGFEASVATYCGAEYAVAVNSATSALHIACLALGVGPGDRVWTSPITFVASANCALYCGAVVEFVDIDARTCNISVQALAEKLEQAERAGALPKVVIPVHLGGQSCDMAAIHALGQRYGFNILEDASHAIGATFGDFPVGSCRFSDVAVFSFHPVKIITTGEGGMVVTNDPQLHRRLELLRSHGITREPSEMSRVPEGSWYYEQIELGFNYRMTDIQAALGSSQMQRLDNFVQKRHEIAKVYDQAFRDLPLLRPESEPGSRSALHLYIVRLDPAEVGMSKREAFAAMRAAGIGVNLHYIPVYRQPYYQRLGCDKEDYPMAEQYYESAMSLPMFPTLGASDQAAVIAAVTALFRRKAKK